MTALPTLRGGHIACGEVIGGSDRPAVERDDHVTRLQASRHGRCARVDLGDNSALACRGGVAPVVAAEGKVPERGGVQAWAAALALSARNALDHDAHDGPGADLDGRAGLALLDEPAVIEIAALIGMAKPISDAVSPEPVLDSL